MERGTGMSINQVSISGNLTRDAEYHEGKPLKFTVAVNERYKEGDQWKDRTSFIDCVLFGVRAEKLEPYMKKGCKVAVSGKLRQNTWETDGEKRSKVEVIASEVEIMYQSRTETKPAYDEDVPFNFGGMS